MFSAIEYIHSLNIIHRDIKAENFLYARDGSIKLIDFGLAIRLKHDSEFAREVVGSAHYLAPEMLDRRYSKPVDIWSAGVLVFLMLYGRYPFDAETDEGVIRRIKIGGIKWESPDFVPSPNISHFLHSLLERDASKRPTASSVLTEPFLTIGSPESGSKILVTAPIIDKISETVLKAARSKRREMLTSANESTRSARILQLDNEFERGTLRGWKKSRLTISAPTSPRHRTSVLGRQSTRGLIQGGPGSTSYGTITPKANDQRSKSLPGSFKVTFDPNPPDLFIYSEGTSNLVKIPSAANSPAASRRI
jgi:serine/threonine protein kinase